MRRHKPTSVEWEHDTYHQDNEQIYFYCPNCHEAIADVPTLCWMKKLIVTSLAMSA